MDGHAVQVGGAIIDSGNFDWDAYGHKYHGLTEPDESYHGVVYTKQFGKKAYITKATTQLMRDLGSIPSPENCFLLNLGLETLPLRVERHCENAQKVAEFLDAHEKVSHVIYAGLPNDKYHELAQKYMDKGRTCGVISFELTGGRDAAVRFMDGLKLANIATHVAASKTMVLHPASHTHRQMNDEQLREAGVSPGMIRLSVGIESAKVLSTINGTSCSWATFANFSISRMTSAGFAIVSANKTLVFGLNAAAISSALASVSTNVQSIPSFFNVTPRRLNVPP